jgi:ketosteroid isomerase-like protein
MTPQGLLAARAAKIQGRPKMTEHSLWRFSRALHRAINERQFNEIDTLIDEDVDWTIHGPVDLFPFFGSRRGKDAVLEVIRQIADQVRIHRFDREAIMLGLESASSLLRYSLTVLDTNKPLRVRLAHFAQFREGRLSSLRILVDSYELVEQSVCLPVRARMIPVSA